MYSAASWSPRVPGPRPSSRSSDRNRTWARIFSASMDSAAARAADGSPGIAGTEDCCARSAGNEMRARARVRQQGLERISACPFSYPAMLINRSGAVQSSFAAVLRRSCKAGASRCARVSTLRARPVSGKAGNSSRRTQRRLPESGPARVKTSSSSTPRMRT